MTDLPVPLGQLSTAERRAESAVSLMDPLSRVLWALIALLSAALALAAWKLGFHIRQLEYGAAYLLGVAVIGLVLRKRGRTRSGAFLECFAQFLLAGIVLGLLALVLAGTGLPYRDAELAFVDRVLFPVDWHAMSTALVADPWMATALNYAYASIGPQPFALLVLLIVTGQVRRLRMFVLAWTITLACVVAIFPFIPAVGAYLHYGIAPGEMPQVLVSVGWRHVEVLQPIRDGMQRDLHFYSFAGVVTFPSFHAAAAILLAWGFWGVPYLRWAGLILNVLMMVSSVPIGAHYVIDLIAGGVIALVALWISVHVARRAHGRCDGDESIRDWRPTALPSWVRRTGDHATAR